MQACQVSLSFRRLNSIDRLPTSSTDLLLTLPLIRLAADNLECVERIWEVTDSGGHTVDWRAVLGAEGRYVGFL